MNLNSKIALAAMLMADSYRHSESSVGFKPIRQATGIPQCEKGSEEHQKLLEKQRQKLARRKRASQNCTTIHQ